MEKPIYKKWWFWLIAVMAIVLVTLFVIIGKNNGGENIGSEPAEPAVEKASEEIKTKASATAGEKASEEVQPEQTANNPTEEPAIEPTDEPTPALGETPGDTMYPYGFYKVGEDMPAGEYKLFAHENTMGTSYFDVAADDLGEFSEILASGNFLNFTYVTVSDGQYFGFDDAYAVPAEEAPPYEPADGKYIPGMYKAGVDIPAGEHKLIFESDYAAYYEHSLDSTHTPESIIASDNFSDDIYVTVNDGEYIYFTGAYIKVK